MIIRDKRGQAATKRKLHRPNNDWTFRTVAKQLRLTSKQLWGYVRHVGVPYRIDTDGTPYFDEDELDAWREGSL